MTITTATTAPAVPLTAQDVAAFKAADTCSLHTSGRIDVVGSGTIVRLYTRTYGDPVVFTTRQQVLFPEAHLSDQRTRTIVASGSVVGYSDGGSTGWSWPNGDRELTPSCFFWSYGSFDKDVWATIVRTLRVGSTLAVHWTADNNTEIARANGLHLDSVRLIVTTGKTVSSFNIGWSAGPDNSARMIQRQR